MAMSRSSAVHGGQYDTKYASFEYNITRGISGGDNFRRSTWTSSYEFPKDIARTHQAPGMIYESQQLFFVLWDLYVAQQLQ